MRRRTCIQNNTRGQGNTTLSSNTQQQLSYVHDCMWTLNVPPLCMIICCVRKFSEVCRIFPCTEQTVLHLKRPILTPSNIKIIPMAKHFIIFSDLFLSSNYGLILSLTNKQNYCVCFFCSKVFIAAQISQNWSFCMPYY